MAEGILIGLFVSAAIILGSGALWLKKQNYEQKMQDMGKKHEVEKMIQDDRIADLQQQLKEAHQKEDVNSKYTNSQGLLSHRRITAKDDN